MSYRIMHAARWICDKCTASTVGYDDVLPNGWSAAVVDAKLEHYCPTCSKSMTASTTLDPKVIEDARKQFDDAQKEKEWIRSKT